MSDFFDADDYTVGTERAKSSHLNDLAEGIEDAFDGLESEVATKATASDVIYGASWNDNTDVPTKNVIYDKIETLAGGHDAVTIGTANGLSLSTQELSLAAATNSSAGAATAAQITKLEGIETGATADQSLTDLGIANHDQITITASGNISSVGTILGRAIDTDGSKLDGIESGATADQSDSEIETAYNNQVSIVSQVIAEAGTSTTVYRWTPERVKQAIDALSSDGDQAASEVDITDSGGYFTGTEVETALQEVGADLASLDSGKQDALDVVLKYDAETGTETTPRLWTAQRVKQAIDSLAPSPGVLHVQDLKTSGTDGGNASSGYNDRDLNTVLTNSISDASLSSNVVTLPAGTYDIFCQSAVHCQTAPRGAQNVIRDDSDDSILLSGLSLGNAYNGNNAPVCGRLVLASETDIKVSTYMKTTTTDGLGYANSSGENEVYTNLVILERS